LSAQRVPPPNNAIGSSNLPLCLNNKKKTNNVSVAHTPPPPAAAPRTFLRINGGPWDSSGSFPVVVGHYPSWQRLLLLSRRGHHPSADIAVTQQHFNATWWN